MELNNKWSIRTKRISTFLICVFFLSSFTGCKNTESKDNISKLMEYNGEYIGNASAVGNILTLLEITYDKFNLDTSNRPYEIQILCTNPKGGKSNEELKQFNLYSSTIIFSLIKNVDEINFIYESELEFNFKRKEANSFFGQKLESFGEDKDKWEKEILQKLDSINIVDSYYAKYRVINAYN